VGFTLKRIKESFFMKEKGEDTDENE